MRKASRITLRLGLGAVALLALAAAPSVFAQSSGSAASSGGDAQRGHQLFLKVGCYECHGTVGQGSIAGPRLAPKPQPLEVLTQIVRNPANAMPPFSAKVLSDQDVKDIHAYLASIPAPPSVASIPALKE